MKTKVRYRLCSNLFDKTGLFHSWVITGSWQDNLNAIIEKEDGSIIMVRYSDVNFKPVEIEYPDFDTNK